MWKLVFFYDHVDFECIRILKGFMQKVLAKNTLSVIIKNVLKKLKNVFSLKNTFNIINNLASFFMQFNHHLSIIKNSLPACP